VIAQLSAPEIDAPAAIGSATACAAAAAGVVELVRADGRLWPRVVGLAVDDATTAGGVAILATFSPAARARPRRPPPVGGAEHRGRIRADPLRSICEKEGKEGRSRTRADWWVRIMIMHHDDHAMMMHDDGHDDGRAQENVGRKDLFVTTF
jgi:hypothetical protein